MQEAAVEYVASTIEQLMKKPGQLLTREQLKAQKVMIQQAVAYFPLKFFIVTIS